MSVVVLILEYQLYKPRGIFIHPRQMTKSNVYPLVYKNADPESEVIVGVI